MSRFSKIRTHRTPFNRPAFGKPFSAPFGRASGGHDEFNPKDIGNLVIWLDAGHGVSPATGPVDGWADQGSNGNDAVGAGSARPVFNPTGINGFPSLTFDGTDDVMNVTSSTSLNFTTSFTAYVVCKNTDDGDFRTMFSKDANTFRFLFADAAGNRGGRAIVGQDTLNRGTTALNSNSIMELHWDVKTNGLINMTQNGLPLGSSLFSTITTISRAAGAFMVGATGAIQKFKGEIGQVIIFDKLLTRNERNDMGNYFASRYQIPWNEIEHTPLELPGLVLWLDAARGVTPGTADVAVSAWADESGSGNDADQPTVGKRPVYKTTAFNGFPTLQFSSTNDENLEIADASLLDFNRVFTAYFAVKSVAQSADRYLMSKGANAGYEIFFDDSNGERLVVASNDAISTQFTTGDTAPTDSTDIILEVAYMAGGIVSFTQNGVPLGELKSNNSSKININTSKLYIGSSDGTAAPFEGEIAQVLLFNRDLSVNERNFVGKYLTGRYNLTWTDVLPFKPTDFDGLVLWLDADQEVTRPARTVSAWGDQSPANNDVAQVDSSKQPLFVHQGLNGKDTITFTRTIQGRTLIAPAAASLNFTGSFSFFAVMDFLIQDSTIISKNGNSGYRVLIDGQNTIQTITSSNTEGPLTLTGGRVPLISPLVLDVNYEVGGANRVRFTNKGASLGQFLNTLTDINSTSADLIVGGLTNSEFLEGDVSQIVLYDNLLSIPERNLVGTYLALRYREKWQQIPNDFDPRDLTGLALWLDASIGVTPFGGRPTRWEDQSGNGYAATQTDSTKTPGFNPLSLGGQGALFFSDFFDGFMEMPVAQNSIMDLQTSFTFYTVCLVEDFNHLHTLISRNQTDGYEIRVNASDKLETFVNDGGGAETDVSAGVVPTGSFRILEVHYDVGGTINFTLNGISIGAPTNTLTGITSNAADFFIGGFGTTPSTKWVGEIAQLIFYNRLLTTEERNRVGLYFSNRFKLPWADITFKPDDISDLTLWFDADLGVVPGTDVSNVQTWTEQTASPLVATQTNDLERASYEFTGLNGHRTLDFDGVNDNYSIPDNNDIDISASFTMYCVCRPGLTGSLHTMFSKNQTNSYVWSITSAGNQRFQSTGTPAGLHDITSTGPATVSTFESVILEIHYDIGAGGSTVSFTKNGLSMGVVPSPATSIFASTIQAFIGASIGGEGDKNFFAGKLSQILLYKRLLTTQERNNVGNYLGARYGITWEEIP